MDKRFTVSSRFLEELANEDVSLHLNENSLIDGDVDDIDRELLFEDALDFSTADDDSTLSVSSSDREQQNNANEEVITLTDTEDDDCIVTEIIETITEPKKENDENLSDDNNEDDCNEDDVEIVQVKYYNDYVDVDEDIEVLSQILTPTEVIDFMKHSLRLVQQTTGLSFTTVRVLMAAYRWHKDHFVNEFHEIGLDRILRTLKLTISRAIGSTAGPTVAKKRKVDNDLESTAGCSKISGNEDDKETASQTITCLVCYDDLEKSQMYCNASCDHSICIECWNNYIASKVDDNASDDKLLCPNAGCSLLMDDEELIALINDQEIRNKYQRLISNKFVTQNDCLRWCPNRTCLHAVKVKYSGSQDIECVCKTVFCFSCGEEWHEPLSCDMFKNWIQKYASQTIDPNSAKWLTKHTKCCPKCKFPIEKNGGCNYVQCTKCAYSFCYHCLGKCSHGSCVGRNELDARAAQEQDQSMKLDLQLYPFYKDNYANQMRQLRLERQLQERVVHKLEITVKSHDFKSALKFLKKGFSVLCHCRQTLMYSYVFDYYIKGPKDIKENYARNLGELERNTIQLSRTLTSETTIIHKDTADQMKRVVQSNYRNCENSRSKLVHHIRQGLEKNLWEFITSNNTPAVAASSQSNELPLNLARFPHGMPHGMHFRFAHFNAGNNIVVNAFNRIAARIWQPWNQQPVNNNVQ